MPFLTVKEAARLVNKSPSAVRRIIYAIVPDDAHPDRDQIEPGVAEVLALRMKGRSFPWRLSEELLRRKIPADSAPEHGSHSASNRGAPASGDGELLAMLRRELDIKNQQITQQNELIKQHAELIGGLSERLREGNVLIGTLQQRLALADGRGDQREPIEANATPLARAGKTEKGSAAPPKSAKAKKGFFTRLFT